MEHLQTYEGFYKKSGFQYDKKGRKKYYVCVNEFTVEEWDYNKGETISITISLGEILMSKYYSRDDKMGSSIWEWQISSSFNKKDYNFRAKSWKEIKKNCIYAGKYLDNFTPDIFIHAVTGRVGKPQNNSIYDEIARDFKKNHPEHAYIFDANKLDLL